jgi:hypothetical protein
MHQQAACPLANIRARMCTNGHTTYRIMERDMEHKLLEIFEALRLPCVLKLVSMSYNRRGGTKLVYRIGRMLKGDVPMKLSSHILVKGEVRCGGASPFYLICKKKNTYILFSTGFSLRQHPACPLACIRESMCANGHVQARSKKHRVEHKLYENFEALRLS